MKGQLHEDNFEDFIRNKINEFDGEPSSNMWERIDGVIPAKPQPVYIKYLAPISVAASFLLVVTLWAVVSQYQSEKEKLTDELEKATQKIEDLTLEKKGHDNELNVIPLDKVEENKKNLNNNISELPTNQITRIPNKNERWAVDNIRRPKRSEKAENFDKPFIQPRTNSKKDIPIAENSNSEIEPKTSIENLNIPEQEKKTTFNLDVLQGIAFQNFTFPTSVNADKMVEPLEPNTRKPKRSLNSGTVFTVTSQQLLAKKVNYKPRPNSGGPLPQPHPHPKKDDLRLANGFNIGIGIQRYLTERWSLGIGVNFQKETVSMRLLNRLIYNPMTETDFDDEYFINNQSYPSNCAFGDMGINLDLFRNKNSQPPLPNQPLELTVNGNHTKQTLNVPVFVQYEIPVNEKISIGARGGVSAQILWDNQFQPLRAETNSEDIIAQSVTLTETPKLSEEVTFDALAGISLHYKIKENIQLSLMPNVFTSIGDKHRSPRGTSKSTLYGIQGGVSYSF